MEIPKTGNIGYSAKGREKKKERKGEQRETLGKFPSAVSDTFPISNYLLSFLLPMTVSH